MKTAVNQFGGLRDAAALLTNAAGLAISAVAGVAVSGILANRFSVDVVGQFNILVMLHIVCAQLAAMGVHLSCLHYLGGARNDEATRVAGAQAAIGVVALSGSVAGACLFCLAGFIERTFDSPGLAHGVRWLGPAIALFGINKVLLALLNASDRLHVYALVQALRPIGWLAGAGAIVHVSQANPSELGMLLFAGEAITMVCGTIALAGQLFARFDASMIKVWFYRHYQFGWRAMPSNFVIELNTRIDVLVLAIFVSDKIVGIYSFVALLAEGIFQIGVLVRTIINRRLVTALVSHDQTAISNLKRSAGYASLGMTFAGSLVLLGGFSPAITLLKLDQALLGGLVPLLILLVGVCACAMYAPFWMAIALAGRPVEHSKLMLALCALNLSINIIAVPTLGMLGAAIATAVMFAAFPWMLRWTAQRTLAITL